MLSGRRPFAGATNADLMAAILTEPPAALSEFGRERPAELDRILFRCLEKVPAQRIQSARELAQALQSLGHDLAPAECATQRFIDTAVGQATPRPSGRQTTVASVAALPVVNLSSGPENE